MKAAKTPKEERLEALDTGIRELDALKEPEDRRIMGLLEQARYRRAILLREGDQETPPPPDSEQDNDEGPVSEVVEATTELPNARAVVEEGAIVVLQQETGP